MRLTVLNVAYPLAPVRNSTAGGAEQILLALDRGLVERGHRSLVLAAAGSRCFGLHIPVPVAPDQLNERAKREARTQFQIRLEEVLARFPVDIIHMHGIDFAHYLPNSPVPTLVTLHLPPSWYTPPIASISRQRATYVCVSTSQASKMPATVRGDGRVVENGVDLQLFRPAGQGGNYVLVLGRICPEKATHMAIDAARHAGEKVVIAGTVFEYAEHRAYFDSMIAPRLSAEVVYIGNVGGARKASLLAGAKCLLIPSLAQETSSLVAMESLACGTPVICRRSGALPEIVAHGSTGYVVASVEEMAEAILRVGNLSRSRCRREAERRFSEQKMIDEYLGLYEQLACGSVAGELQAA